MELACGVNGRFGVGSRLSTSPRTVRFTARARSVARPRAGNSARAPSTKRTIAACRSWSDARKLRPLRAEGEERGKLAARPCMGEHGGVSLELFSGANERARREGRGTGGVERRRARRREQINQCSASGRQPQARSGKGENGNVA